MTEDELKAIEERARFELDRTNQLDYRGPRGESETVLALVAEVRDLRDTLERIADQLSEPHPAPRAAMRYVNEALGRK